MAGGGKGGGGGGGATIAVVVAMIGLVGVLGAAYINNMGKTPDHKGGGHHASNTATGGDSGNVVPPPPPAPYMGQLVPNTSYSGGDYDHMQLDNPYACASTCLAQAQCKSMTYDGNAKTCWLKASVPPGLYGQNFTSAVKLGT